MNPIAVYLPADARGHTIPQASGIVGSPSEEWLEAGAGERGYVLLDYEPPSAAVNIKTFGDRCYHAADRHQRHYPSHKRMLLPERALIRVGTYWPDRGVVALDWTTVTPEFALRQIGEWLGLDAEVEIAQDLRATHLVDATGGR